eukprot:m.202040 g.202040  ORF g.202040 m.202040 type:complete len:191 (+) comp10690_c0_seq4:454-1026(+)
MAAAEGNQLSPLRTVTHPPTQRPSTSGAQPAQPAQTRSHATTATPQQLPPVTPSKAIMSSFEMGKDKDSTTTLGHTAQPAPGTQPPSQSQSKSEKIKAKASKAGDSFVDKAERAVDKMADLGGTDNTGTRVRASRPDRTATVEQGFDTSKHHPNLVMQAGDLIVSAGEKVVDKIEKKGGSGGVNRIEPIV